ncbi:hypothetical protein T281_09840 [Rhodomicrobium udaipurense JA643]|uniref:Uncharacterized protein n=1 Tax=Rhodomicrobium udaipurense TaxID=1202716 RepID=A0A8I1GDK2_9HYPH|nr:hypothetical protein [Rhodomicrobium udaipurense]KAI94650.1 hypothetical protein T281_09840 [Rhodomicrobium udaipurense JA643]MBJ7542974.1 hypothetical protein [Rhodomicrobium udaipurense]
MSNFDWSVSIVRGVMIPLGLSMALAGAASAEDEGEKAKLSQCAKDLCSIIVSKDANGPDVTCDVTKTWQKEEIQKGAEQKKLSWGQGSAKCSAKVSVKRADIVASLTKPDHELKVEKQAVSCEIGESKYPISATLAPELKFKDGASTNAALHINDIQGATLIKGAVWTAATLEQNFGLFEKDLVREINRFVSKECPKILEAK